MDPEAAKLLGAGLAMGLGAIGPGIGLGLIGGSMGLELKTDEEYAGMG